MSTETTQDDGSGATQSKPGVPTIESLHRDIQFANDYRKELIKHLLTIAAALFAFTVAFRPSLSTVALEWTMWLGWAGLGLSMIGGMFHMLGWEHYYKSYHDYDWELRAEPNANERGKDAREIINLWRRTAMFFQFVGFAVGVAFIAAFATANLENTTKGSSVQAEQSQTGARGN